MHSLHRRVQRELMYFECCAICSVALCVVDRQHALNVELSGNLLNINGSTNVELEQEFFLHYYRNCRVIGCLLDSYFLAANVELAGNVWAKLG